MIPQRPFRRRAMFALYRPNGRIVWQSVMPSVAMIRKWWFRKHAGEFRHVNVWWRRQFANGWTIQRVEILPSVEI